MATKPNMRKIIPINGLMILPSTIKMRLRTSIKNPKTVPMPANIFRTVDWLFSFVTVSSIFEATARPMVPAVTGSPCISKWSDALSARGAMTQRMRYTKNPKPPINIVNKNPRRNKTGSTLK